MKKLLEANADPEQEIEASTDLRCMRVPSTSVLQLVGSQAREGIYALRPRALHILVRHAYIRAIKGEAGLQDYKDLVCDLPLPQFNMQNGETFLMRAAKDNSSEMVENLLKYHADPNRQDKVHYSNVPHMCVHFSTEYCTNTYFSTFVWILTSNMVQ